MMDSKPRMVCDSRGNPAGQRPGFLYADSDIDLAVKETVYREYADAISNRWQSDRWSKPSGNLSTVDKVQSTGDAYEQYRRDIEAGGANDRPRVAAGAGEDCNAEGLHRPDHTT
jgi:hypothetical protein